MDPCSLSIITHCWGVLFSKNSVEEHRVFELRWCNQSSVKIEAFYSVHVKNVAKISIHFIRWKQWCKLQSMMLWLCLFMLEKLYSFCLKSHERLMFCLFLFQEKVLKFVQAQVWFRITLIFPELANAASPSSNKRGSIWNVNEMSK